MKSLMNAYGFYETKSLEDFILKYKKGSIVEKNDENIIDHLRMHSGMIHIGITQKEDGEFASTAKLLPEGCRILNHELRIEKYAAYRLLHGLACFFGPPYKLN